MKENLYSISTASTLTCTILCFVLVLGETKTKTKLFLVLQWYFDLSKQKVFVLVWTKPKQNRAGQLLRVRMFHYVGKASLLMLTWSDRNALYKLAFDFRVVYRRDTKTHHKAFWELTTISFTYTDDKDTYKARSAKSTAIYAPIVQSFFCKNSLNVTIEVQFAFSKQTNRLNSHNTESHRQHRRDIAVQIAYSSASFHRREGWWLRQL